MNVVDPTHDMVSLGVVTAVLFFAVMLGTALLARSRPSLAVVALIAAAPFDVARYVGQTTITTEKAALVGAAIGLLSLPAIRDHLPALRRVPLAWCLLALTIVTLGTYAVSLSHEAVLRETAKSVQYLATFVLVWAASRVDADEAPLLYALPALLVVVAVGAIAQLATGAPSTILTRGVPLPRVAGALEGPNQLAGYLGLLLPMALLAIRTPLGRIALVLGGVALVLSYSRTGILASAIALGLAFWWLGPAMRRAGLAWTVGGFVAGGAATLGVGAFELHAKGGGVFSDVFGHLLSTSEVEQSGGVGTRSELWRGALVLWRRHPLFGIGAGNFELEVGSVTRHGIRTHANSWYLQALVEGGVPLLAATLATVWYATVGFLGRVRAVPFVAAATAASVGLCLHQIADFLVFYPKVGATWWVLLGVAAARAASD